MMRWIVVICAAVILIIASCMKVSGRCARQEEIELEALAPCPVCGQTPRLEYCCGEYFVCGGHPWCRCCSGTEFCEMHSDPRLEVEAWNRWVLHLRCGVGVFPADQANEAGEVQGNEK